MPWFAEVMSPLGHWSPVKFTDRPKVKGGRIMKAEGLGQKIRGLHVEPDMDLENWEGDGS